MKRRPESVWPEADKTEELLAKAQGGDDAAVGNLLDRHRTALRRMVDMRMDAALKRRVDASDIVQDVLVEANRRLQDYLSNPAMPFHLWLRHMAKDRIIDAHRRHRVAQRRSLDREQPLVAPGGMDHSTMELAEELWDGELTPQAAATRREAIIRFQQALEELDEADQEIVLMRNFEQLSNQEVAQALGLSEPAASMRYLRAIRKLRPKLGGDEGDGDTPTDR
ncbi:MAG: sigma-70 family RNA polymerase sigma factor [Pirellulales bacterium]|nr:sigma-70 family RNA polymerase sigma factor [Pirellulales bacterium]